MTPDIEQEILPPKALVLISPGCAHCAQVMQSLQDLLRQGALSRLEMINIVADPEPARVRGVRSVPWMQIGPFVLEGAHSPAELHHWIEQANSRDGMAWYFDEQLKTGQLARVEAMVRASQDRLDAIITLAADSDTAMQTRVGIAALLESLEGSGLATGLAAPLEKLTRHPDARVRADACHYLALTENELAIGILKGCLTDEDPVVRDIVTEGIDHLKQHLHITG